MKQLFLFLILMCSASVFAQTATITFTSQDTVTVRVAKPVDGNYNPYYLLLLYYLPDMIKPIVLNS